MFTGIRASELLKIKISDINFAEKTLKIVEGKMKKERLIPLIDKVLLPIKRYIKARRHSTGSCLIIQYNKDKPLTYIGLRRIIHDLVLKLNIKRSVTTRFFRKAFASDIINKGGDIAQLRFIMGHSKLNMTSDYINISIKQLRKTINMNPIIHNCKTIFREL
jgi:site-specific recombinase XerD